MKELENLGFTKTEGPGALMSNLGKLVAAICAAIAVLVTFTDITFGGLGTKEMTTVLAMLLTSAYVIYFSLEESGERRGEETEEFRSASSRHRELCSRITPEMLPDLRSYITDYTLEEAASRRRTLLMRAGFTEEDYDASLIKKARINFRPGSALVGCLSGLTFQKVKPRYTKEDKEATEGEEE